MTDYPYVMSPDKIPGFFAKIGGIGVPPKFTNQTLKSIGYTSSNDSRFVSLIRFLGFIDSSGAPSSRWAELRKSSKQAIGLAIRSGYADLFHQYPDAYQRDDEALRTYFSANSGVGAQAVSKMLSTFKAVCRLADFSDVEADDDNDIHDSRVNSSAGGPRDKRGESHRSTNAAGGLTLNINIQLQLPADATSDTYERFFSAMRKYLISAAPENA